MDDQLSDILPEHTQQELLPLFQKARLITSNAVYNEDEASLLDILTKDRKRTVGLVQSSIIQELALGITHKATKIYKDIFNIEYRETKKYLKTLSTLLESYGMPELARALSQVA